MVPRGIPGTTQGPTLSATRTRTGPRREACARVEVLLTTSGFEGPSRPAAECLRPQVEEQGAAYQSEGEARREKSDERRTCEDRKDSEGSAPRHAARSGGH